MIGQGHPYKNSNPLSLPQIRTVFFCFRQWPSEDVSRIQIARKFETRRQYVIIRGFGNISSFDPVVVRASRVDRLTAEHSFPRSVWKEFVR